MTVSSSKYRPECGLYLRLPPDFARGSGEGWAADLKAFFFAINHDTTYEKNMHAVERPVDPGLPDYKERAQAVVSLIQSRGVVAIVRGDADMAKALGADGVLLEKPAQIADARSLLGEEAIIGARCMLFEDLMEEAVAKGTDFVTLGFPDDALPPESTVRWWADFSDLTAVVEGAITKDNAADYVKAGAGFLEVSSYILKHPKGVMQGTSDMLNAIEEALDAPQEIRLS